MTASPPPAPSAAHRRTRPCATPTTASRPHDCKLRTKPHSRESRRRRSTGNAQARAPTITRGSPIDTYSDPELLSLAQWIRSDEVLRTEDELLQEMMQELGYQRRGKNVVARLTATITRSAASPPRRHGPRDR